MKISKLAKTVIREARSQYSRKSLETGYAMASRTGGVMMKSACTVEPVVSLPVSCFTRTKKGEYVLYRGLKTYGKQYANSVAASAGQSRKEILAQHKNKKISDIIMEYTGLTQHGDPVLHTTTKRKIARQFAGNNGVIAVYRVPKKYLERFGYLGHIGENEISFFHSIPKKFVHKIIHTPPPKNHKDEGLQALLPKQIDITF